ncbi:MULTISPECIES: MarR family transcriptional regulator [unclassified Rathayibacter]|jgi:DNA-binding MarR family transcriptional regulator|uniref:MarR family winged helix-turn-helix transcriptional regulator n=1 Tax=unclassified Rathayibacter TaxID=2609250 RepID=UPI000CE92D3C|nr:MULTISPECIES: MarR family transcriptional regulator [unclassified Rathayibacter]PPF39540.1 MarR family transcriptional regulator [Rathayibacter sp. AY1A3]PPG31676.1 MarR family transcriptional regulator [Rathayibacter sp. AY2B9]PPG44061.1 MarR family transcriptional regulator [Rathayibacter sp. AY2B5]PPH13021.1 MarR family transcriptional regulator [Rathayibacter sp. AY1C1]PPH47417.1 MarR family transcriptional regulator [Rathayibacter sp. AY1C9]
MSDTSLRSGAGYWYPDESSTRRAVEVLSAMRTYRVSEVSMRRRTRERMAMGETDLIAIQYLLRQQRKGELVTGKDLASHLSISSASTTVLIDRLVRSGHLVRKPNPTDRRGIVVEATVDSDDEVRATLQEMHRRMLEIAEDLDAPEAEVVVNFLRRMSAAVDEIDAEHGDGHDTDEADDAEPSAAK